MSLRFAHWLKIGRDLHIVLELLAELDEQCEEGLEHDLAGVLKAETTSQLARVTALLHNARERRASKRPCSKCQGTGRTRAGHICGLCFGQTEP